jgi:hypothetical protein
VPAKLLGRQQVRALSIRIFPVDKTLELPPLLFLMFKPYKLAPIKKIGLYLKRQKEWVKGCTKNEGTLKLQTRPINYPFNQPINIIG